MEDARGARVHHAPGRLRDRRRPRRRGHDHARPLPLTRLPVVTLFRARGCHLCDSARAVLDRVRAEAPFDLREVDITGVDELERAYRERIPVVAVEGEEVFTYFVHPAALRRRLHEVGSS